MHLAGIYAARLVVTLLALAAIAGQVAHLDALSETMFGLSHTLTNNPRPSFLTLVAADAVVSAVTGIVAVTLVFRGIPGRGAMGLALALGAWSYLMAYSGIVVLLRPDPGMLRTLFEAHFPVVELIGLAGIVRFTALFPRQLEADDLSPPASLPIGLRTLQHARIRLLSPVGPWVSAVIILVLLLGLNRMAGARLADAGLNPLMDIVRFLAVALVVFNMRRSWVRASNEGRDRISWVFVGLSLFVGAIVLLIGGNILFAAAGWPEPTVAWRPILLDVGLLGFLWGLSMAAFYDGALRSGVVARRIASLTVLAALILFLATGLEVLLSSALVGRISLPPGLGTIVAVMSAIATYGRTLPFIEKILDLMPDMGSEQVATG